MRSCYITRAKMFRDTDGPSVLHWYFTDKPFVRVNSCIQNAYWHADNHQWEDVLGEVSGAPRPYAKGKPPVYAPSPMGPEHICGTADEWANGAALADALSPDDWDIFGRVLCCKPTPPVALGAGAYFYLSAPYETTATMYNAVGLVAALGTGRVLAADLSAGAALLAGQAGSGVLMTALPAAAGILTSPAASGSLQVRLAGGAGVRCPLGAGHVLTARLGAAGGISSTPQVTRGMRPTFGLSAGFMATARQLAGLPVSLGLAAAFHASPAVHQGLQAHLGLVGAVAAADMEVDSFTALAGERLGLSATLNPYTPPDMPGQWSKTVLSYTQMLVASTQYPVTLRNMAAGEILHAIVLYMPQAFGGGTLTVVQLNMGYTGGQGSTGSSNGYYCSAVDIRSADIVPPHAFGTFASGSLADCQNVAAPWTVNALIACGGGNLNQLLSGQLTIWLLTSILP